MNVLVRSHANLFYSSVFIKEVLNLAPTELLLKSLPCRRCEYLQFKTKTPI